MKDVILGDAYGYGSTLINITDKLGAFGTAYVNDDDELVAFTAKSTALTGKIDGAKFKVGDTKYDIESTITKSAIFNNTDKVSGYAGVLTATGISAAAVNTDDGETVTINVDLSGKKIKDVYSVVAWDATEADLASSDVQEDIADDELLNQDFVLDDNDNIDLKSFQLVGVASLDKIAEDNVVYVYTDTDGDIRKVAVGTEKVEGVVEETDDVDLTITIDGKEYDLAANSDLTIPGDVDVDSEGIFYLDANGEVFDFEGTTGNADTYAIVKFAQGEGADNAKLKLYTSDDSTKTYTFADSIAKTDFVVTTGGIATNFAGIAVGDLVGYSLDSDGGIDTVDLTAKVYTTTDGTTSYQSTKVMTVDGTSRSIDSNAVVFTYSGPSASLATADFDVAKISEVKKGSVVSTTEDAIILMNDDNKVVAMLISENFVDADDDDVYGVFNTRNNAKTGDDEVYRFTGFIDGNTFSKKTDDRSNGTADDPLNTVSFNSLVGAFGVYKITVDVNDVITKVEALVTPKVIDDKSGYVATNVVIDSLNSDRTVVTEKTTLKKYTIADDAVVYKYDASKKEYSVAKLSNLRKDYTVSLYDTKGSDADGIASVVIYMED